MTVETETAQPTTQSGVLKKGKGFLWTLAAVLGAAAVAAWIALGVGLYFDAERGTKVILVVVAAVATEALFWTVAAALGVSVLEARKRIWRRITGQA